MKYSVIGLMSGSSLDGLDIVFVDIQEISGKWTFEVKAAGCLEYDATWGKKLQSAIHLPAKEYQLLHTEYGKYLGEKVNEFIEMNHLEHQVNLIASHGHTTFHCPEKNMTHQLGDGAAIAAATALPVVSDLRSLDVAFGGQGAPIVPMGEKLLFPEHRFFLNIGGIANISIRNGDQFIAYDVCPANRVLNMLSAEINKTYDDGGQIASTGSVNRELLNELNNLDYFTLSHPKSLANSFGTDIIYPLIKKYGLRTADSLCTYAEHIAIQIKNSLNPFSSELQSKNVMITGGGAFNKFVVSRIQHLLLSINYQIYIPADEVVNYKEALIMALLGTLRWREQYTVLTSVTGASRNSVGGALWLGTEA